jgi:protein-S-isoprenylcysteine O-methyltransferase Ste14
MDPWLAKAAVVAGCVGIVAIRAPHGQRSRKIEVVESAKGKAEFALLTLAWLGFFAPLVWAASPALAFADYPLRVVPFVAGVACMALGLWLFHRSHADLGTNWSITLELRADHQLVTHGLYRSVRHPMYLALLVYALGQALVLPNWVAGPSYLVVMVLLILARVGPEERLMLQRFGADYAAYQERTARLIPRVW